METDLLRDIKHYTGFSEVNMASFINKAPYSYKQFTIKKRSGGNRLISQPTRETKALQYALIDLFFTKLPIHDIAYAYRPIKSPLKKLAQLHKDTDYSLKIDFKNFFPSINFDDLRKILESNKHYELEKNDYDAIRNICFLYRKGDWILSIGAPSSPIISNLVMYELDKCLKNLAIETNKDGKITRYADDIVFSSNDKEASDKFLNGVIKLLESTESPKLKLNNDKTFYLSKANRRRVTGLILTPDGKVSIGRDRKRMIKSLVNSFKYGELDQEEIYKLQGYLNFVKDVEPEFYTRLVIKYTSEVVESVFSP
jgi:hypothetical protein